MAPPKDIARSYPKRGITADVGFRSEPKFCGDGSIELNGSNQYLNAELSSALGNSFTIMAWVKRLAGSAFQYIFDTGNFTVSGGEISLAINFSNNLYFYDGSGSVTTTTFNVDLATWHHVAIAVAPGSGNLKIYADGIDVTPTHSANINITDTTFEIGRHIGANFYLDGRISDVRIYDETLTQDQIRELRNNPGQTIPTGLTSADLIHRYLLETDTNDSGATGNNLTANNSPSFSVDRPQLPRGLDLTGGFKSPPLTFDGGCVSLNGSTQGAKSATSYSAAASGAKSTLACWVNTRNMSGSNRTVVSNCIHNANDNLNIFQSGTNEIDGGMYDSGTVNQFAAKNLDENRWYFVAVTYDADASDFRFYVDGVQFSDTVTLGYGATTGQFEIGYRDNFGSNIQHLDGSLAHVMLIEDVLTQGEIVELMRDTSYAKAQTFGTVNRYYELDADFNDDTGSHNATSVGSPTFTTIPANPTRLIDPSRGAAQARCFTGRAVDFDGSADYLDIGQKDFGTGDFSISLWFYDRQSSGGNRSLFSKGTFNTVGGLLLYNVYGATAADQYILFRNDAQATGSFDDRITITSKAEPNVWHHIAVTRTGGTVKGYFDGKLTASSTNFNPAWDINVAQNSFIGARDPSSPGSFWDGFISSVKVWDTVLTDAQVAEQFHNPEQVLPTGTSASNLDRYYPLSDYNDTGGTGGRYFQDMGADGVPAEDKGSASMEFAQPVPCPQLGLQQSATRLHFPGATTTAAATIPALGTAASLSCWFFWDNSSRTSYPMAVGTVNSATDGLNIRIDTSGNVTTYESTDFDSGLNVTEGTWNHIVIVSQTASPYWKCFVNNTEATSPAAKSAAINITSTNAHAGTNGVNFGAAGIVADAAIWSSELSDANVAALYNSGVMGADVSQVDSSNLVAWWKCDDLTSCKDFSGNGRAMSYSTTLNAASFPENASGSTLVGDFSLKRKGVSVLNPALPNSNLGVGLTACKIPNDGTFDLDASKGFSASGFMRLQEVNVYTTIFSNTTYNTAGKRLTLGMFGGGNEFRFPDSGGTNRTLAFNPDVTDSDWHHLAATMDFSTNTVKVFLDGVLNATTTSFTLGSVSGMGDLVIGDLRPGGQHQEAAVACVKLYQVTLSENEIEQIYRSDLRLIKGLANE